MCENNYDREPLRMTHYSDWEIYYMLQYGHTGATARIQPLETLLSSPGFQGSNLRHVWQGFPC